MGCDAVGDMLNCSAIGKLDFRGMLLAHSGMGYKTRGKVRGYGTAYTSS